MLCFIDYLALMALSVDKVEIEGLLLNIDCLALCGRHGTVILSMSLH